MVPCTSHSLACSHLLNRITFRNCAPWVKNQVVTPWQLLTHSDQFVPENMQVRCLLAVVLCSFCIVHPSWHAIRQRTC